MVMPSMPIPLRASLTSSSLCGWIIASIFFMSSRFEIITLFAVHANVQAFQLLVGRNAYADQHIANLEDDEGPNDRETPGDGHADYLIQHLTRMSIDQP